MSVTLEKVMSEALELPPQVRAFIAEKLIESLDVEPNAALSPEWTRELQQRCIEIENGTAKLHNAEEVFTRAFAALQ
jgi:hypothetical protein